MDFRLEPVTKAGQRFAELAEQHAQQAAEVAAEHDRAGTFPHEVFQAMKDSGFMTATAPEEHGGLGLYSTHDLAVGLSRLARGDASVAIAANMHLVFAPLMKWVQRFNREQGDEETAQALDGLLGMLGGGLVAMANMTEPGTDVAHPLLEATKVDGGYRLNGRKIFGTLCEIADLFLVGARFLRDDGSWGAANAFVFRGSEGQDIKSNWDSLGMRASGSHDVVYADCFVPENLFFPGGGWGEDEVLGLTILIGANIPLQGPFLGVAEAARDAVVQMAKKRTKAPTDRPIAERPGIQHLVAEMDADLAVCRALLARTALLFDTLVLEGPIQTVDSLHEINHQFQCMKLVVNRKAIDVVDSALTVTGGGGYMTASPLSRAYRDVRAGPFMQPFSPNEAYEYIGKVALGLDPDVTR